MSQLILKRGMLYSDEWWQGEDYDVFADGKVVGRIYENVSVSAPPDMQWFWSVTTIVPVMPGSTNGHAATRVEAMAKFRTAWDRRALTDR